jgi:predicted nucleic acid-binding protein
VTGIVIDASTVIPWFVEEPVTPAAERLIACGRPLLAPDFVLVEVANVLLARGRRGQLARGSAAAAARMLGQPDRVALHPIGPLLAPAIALAETVSHGLYDCLYLALALREGAALATFDRRLAAIAARAGVAVWAAEPA